MFIDDQQCATNAPMCCQALRDAANNRLQNPPGIVGKKKLKIVSSVHHPCTRWGAAGGAVMHGAAMGAFRLLSRVLAAPHNTYACGAAAARKAFKLVSQP